ncbi:hypothetical protein J6590_022383 [Homalodisca vitripennis]|nr:hypothetical protein J6590_022383 [Homalodisca vitripennis]
MSSSENKRLLPAIYIYFRSKDTLPRDAMSGTTCVSVINDHPSPQPYLYNQVWRRYLTGIRSL